VKVLSRLDTIPTCDGQTDRRNCHANIALWCENVRNFDVNRCS